MMAVVRLICGEGGAVVRQVRYVFHAFDSSPYSNCFVGSYDGRVRRDPEDTRRRLLHAASTEFSLFGFAGARIERISAASAANRERIYANFGDKRGLFTAVLEIELQNLLSAIAVRGTGPEAVAAFADDYFDETCTHPNLARLAAWEGLELGGDAVGLAARSGAARVKIEELATAAGMTSATAEQVFLTVVTLSHGWVISPNISSVVLGADGAQLSDRRRTAVRAAAHAASG